MLKDIGEALCRNLQAKLLRLRLTTLLIFDSVRNDASLHVDRHPHPGPEPDRRVAAARHLKLAALKDSRPGYRDALKSAGAFGDSGLSMIESVYEAAPELFDFRKGMRLPALVDND